MKIPVNAVAELRKISRSTRLSPAPASPSAGDMARDNKQSDTMTETQMLRRRCLYYCTALFVLRLLTTFIRTVTDSIIPAAQHLLIFPLAKSS